VRASVVSEGGFGIWNRGSCGAGEKYKPGPVKWHWRKKPGFARKHPHPNYCGGNSLWLADGEYLYKE
jgi:hypothetical protein